MGKQIRNYDEAKWQQRSSQVLYDANCEKFTQLPLAKSALLATGNDHLGEATIDPVYGIGLCIDNPQALDSDKWKGSSFLYCCTVFKNSMYENVARCVHVRLGGSRQTVCARCNKMCAISILDMSIELFVMMEAG